MASLDKLYESLLQVPEVWKRAGNTGQIPAIRQPSSGPCEMRMPWAHDNREWLRAGNRNRPKWDGDAWSFPRTWLAGTIRAALARYGRVYLIHAFNELEICAPACMNAKGVECNCSCMGANHGSDDASRWWVVSDTFAVRWATRDVACNLITPRPPARS